MSERDNSAETQENLIFEIIENDDILSNIGISDSAGRNAVKRGNRIHQNCWHI